MSLLQRIFGSEGHEAGAHVDPMIDRIIKASDHRLQFVNGIHRTLRPPVMAASEKLREAIARIPGPTEVSTRAWSQDDTVRALFARAADASAAFSQDESVRAFFAAHPASDCVAMLGLLQTQRRVLANALYGDSVQAEVARTTVNFGEPQILAPGVDEASVREELLNRALEYLGLRALERVGSMRAQRHELEKERALLNAQLQLAKKRGAGFGGIGTGQMSSLELNALEQDLRRTVGELEQAASQSLLPALVEELLDVLAKHEEHLAIEPCTLSLDAMNFAVEASPQALTPRVAMLRLQSRGPFAVVIARFPRSELRTDNRLAEAAKYL